MSDLVRDPSGLDDLRLTLSARAIRPRGVARGTGVALRELWEASSARAWGALRAAARAVSLPAPAIAYWSIVATIDLFNDWIVSGLVGGFRPVAQPLTEVTVWWIPWIAVTPLLVAACVRIDPRSIGWPRSLALHLGVMAVAISAHGLAVAWIFDVLSAQPGHTLQNFARFAAMFTLSEALLYWGFAATLYLTRSPTAPREPSTPGTKTHDVGPVWVRRFAVRDGEVTRYVPVGEVDYIESAGNYVRLHIGTGEHLLRVTLAEVAERLDPGRFKRVHRSTVVNLDRVAALEPWFNGGYLVKLRDGRQLRVSRTYRDDLLAPLS